MRGQKGLPAEVLVDDDVRIWALQYCWQVLRRKHTSYVQRCVGPRKSRTARLLHREIMGLQPGDPREADHMNGDGLDNRRSNLRIVTKGQNCANRVRMDRRNTTGLRGVVRARGRWQAQCGLDGKHHFLGYYETRAEAEEVVRRFRLANTASLR